MLFLNISSDQVNIEIQNEKLKLDRDKIENKIGPTLVKLYRKYSFDKIFLLNGPGGFTNLRVGTLAINLLNTLEKGGIDIYSISKIDFFKYFINQNILPNKGIIYIGQRKNVRLYDFEKQKYETIKIDNIDKKEDIFFDLVYEKDYFDTETIGIFSKNNNIILKYKGKEFEISLENLDIKAQKMVEANYFIQPIMGKQGQ
ncbi:MAG TPA: hypothetical protein PK674_02315 [Candidatus Absconditabacterales bacterium]|nr:hypothetical protein [Candidatus Absconditabacterales bacterium]HOQ79411.1 hypothetical protein [Candidatus Absconditabacterales bacterium]HPK27898.1 hypothetical protein [Candidatus Absconditabacterales bacterium]